MDRAPASVIVSDLACARGGLVTLSGVGFTLARGQALVLRGPNGIGKTTLLRTLAGLQPAVSGRVSAPPEAMAYASHADAVKPALSVAENLAFWARLFGTADVGRAMSAFDLSALAARPAGALSAGQRRRLGLARMLVTARPVWLLDEPTVSLDARSVGLFVAAVARHLEQGGSALIATHIDLGITADVLDLTPFRATLAPVPGDFDEAFA